MTTLDPRYTNLSISMKTPCDRTEPDDDALRIDVKITAQDEDYKIIEVGTFSAFLATFDRFSKFDVLDSVEETATYLDVVDATGDEWVKPIQKQEKRLGLGSNLLILDRMEIKPEFRGRRLGLLAARRLMDIFQDQYTFVLIKPYPLQFAGYKAPDWVAPEGVTNPDKDFRAARRKLERYWAQLGFVPLRRTELWFLNPWFTDILPNIDDILRGELIDPLGKDKSRTSDQGRG